MKSQKTTETNWNSGSKEGAFGVGTNIRGAERAESHLQLCKRSDYLAL